MKIAIPASENNVLCPHFGHAPLFAIIELKPELKQVLDVKVLKPEKGGHAAIPPWLAEMGVSVLIARGLGAAAIDNLNQHQIKVHYGAPELPVEEIARKWMEGSLSLDPRPCTHNHDHDCSHRGE